MLNILLFEKKSTITLLSFNWGHYIGKRDLRKFFVIDLFKYKNSPR